LCPVPCTVLEESVAPTVLRRPGCHRGRRLRGCSPWGRGVGGGLRHAFRCSGRLQGPWSWTPLEERRGRARGRRHRLQQGNLLLNRRRQIFPRQSCSSLHSIQVSILGDLQNSGGQGSEQPELAWQSTLL